jgi:hypothetical protein
MYRNKYTRIKKGYILVDTLLLGLIALAVALLCFSLVLVDLRYNKSYYRYTKNCIDVRNYKEYLLTQVNDSIKEYAADKTTDDIKDYIKTHSVAFNTLDKKANISFDSTKDLFTLKSYYSSTHHREDYFDIIVENTKVKYVYKSTIYTNGRID